MTKIVAIQHRICGNTLSTPIQALAINLQQFNKPFVIPGIKKIPMATTNTLDKFIKAQDKLFQVAFEEIKNGKKRSHWMWFIFPQIKGLGFSEMSHYYAIANLQEAQEYLNHPVLGKRLMEISSALLQLATADPNLVFGSPDDIS